MKWSKWYFVFTLAIVTSLLLGACAQPTPKVEERIVTKEVRVTVEKIITKEVEKVVTKEVEKVVVATPTPVPGEEKVTLDYNLGTEPPTLDPALATDVPSVTIIEQLFLGLTDLAEKDMSAQPELATDWTSEEDGRVWIFHMRKDVPWVWYNPATGEVEVVKDEEGNPRVVKAQDVVYGVKRTLDPRTASDYAYVLYVIKGGEALNNADPNAEN